MAGIQALVNQNAGGPQGNPNPIYYQLAATEYGANGDSSCNSTLGNAVASSCIFYDVTLGDMDINCTGTNDCYLPSGTNGVLSTSDASYLPAYGTQTGWDFATGIGSVNAYNLVNNWPTASATSTSVTCSPSTVNFGVAATCTATVTTTGSNTPTGTVTFYSGTTSLGTGGTLSGSGTQWTTSLTTAAFPVGMDSITANYGGDPYNASSTSPPFTETVNAPAFTAINTGVTSATVSSGVPGTGFAFTVAPVAPATSFGATVTLSCTFSPSDPTLTGPPSACAFSPSTIAATAGSTPVTLQINTAGPNQAQPGIRRRRADNRSPWLPLALPLAGIVMAGFAGRKVWKHSAVASLCVSLVLLGLLVACGGNSNSTPIIVGVSQGTPPSVYPNGPNGAGWPLQTAQFTATVTGTNNQAVAWTVTTANGGTIDSTGLYTAPTIAVGLPTTVTIQATSQADTTKVGSVPEALTPATVPGTYNVTVTVTDPVANPTTQTLPLTLVVQ
jgi:hypothetical protein